jgi:protocatechuate 3,4-dioxygenase beta subunit
MTSHTPAQTGAATDHQDDHQDHHQDDHQDDHQDHHHGEGHDRGLAFDVGTLLARRSALQLFGGASLLALAGCAAETVTPSASASSAASSATASSSAATRADTPGGEVPDETGGPYPGDGSNGPNVLDDSGIVRSDITTSYETATSRAEGVPLTVNLTLTDAAKGYAALAGAAVYLWHCDRDGNYSLYAQGLENENYLRGVQESDSAGTVTFRTIFPGAYSGRWPHIHFEVYSSVQEATTSGPIVKTSQIALPQAACEQAYASSGYERSVENLQRSSLTSDHVFGDDGGVHQLATVTGSASEGFVANLTIGV